MKLARTDVVFFVALLATAVALGGALAHAFELPNKIGLPGDEYFIVQKAYRGWNLLALVLLVEFVSMLVLTILYWQDPRVRWPLVVAMSCLLSAQIAFWLFTYPANVATSNWTAMPQNWEKLRSQWEYSHFAGALFQLAAMSFLIVAALSRR
jgi:hypothetical protein